MTNHPNETPEPLAGLTAERLRELLHYDPATGVFVWRVDRPGGVKSGDQAGCGCKKSDRYLRIGIDRRLYLAHRLAWLYVTGQWPASVIDHKNRVKIDNRFDNLRDVTLVINQQNIVKPRKDSSSKIKGVDRKGNKWRAQIRFEGKVKHLGYFSDIDAARFAYLAAKEQLHPGAIV